MANLSANEFVLGAVNGDDVTRIGWVIFDLLAQLGDVRVNRSRKRETIVSPDRIQQLIASDDFASMGDLFSILL